MASALRSLLGRKDKDGVAGATGSTPPTATTLFPVTDPAVDGDACAHDCASCTVQYPRGFKIDEDDVLYGRISGWSTHLLVATGKADWVRSVADEKGSLMEAVARAPAPANGALMLSASNMPTPGHGGYDEPTRVVVLPAFVGVDGVTPGAVPALLKLIEGGPTNTAPLGTPLPPLAPPATPLNATACPHRVLVLLCSQKTRDARCGQSAPLLRRELERHLRPLGLYRDLDDERPGGVGIYFISHVGGHKYSANVLVYRRPDPWGVDALEQGKLSADERAAWPARIRAASLQPLPDAVVAAGAAQCLWLARVAPADCANLVQYTILQGKVVKPGRQLRGGFDRARGVMSW